MRPSINLSQVKSHMRQQVLPPVHRWERNATFVATDVSPTSIALQGWSTTDNNLLVGVGFPYDYWKDAELEALTGPDAGSVYRVMGSWADSNNKLRFALDPDPNIQNGNAVAIRLPQVPGEWDEEGLPILRAPQVRGQWHEIGHWFDDEHEHLPAAGRQFNAGGKWHVHIPIKRTTSKKMTVHWFREGEAARSFLLQEFDVGDETKIEMPLVIPNEDNDAPPGRVGFTLRFDEGSETVLRGWYLTRTDQTNPTVLTDAALDMLKELKPEVIRGHYGQLGASSAHTTKSSRSLESLWGWDWHLSLYEFLNICREVGADPWIIGATHWSIEQWKVWLAVVNLYNSRHDCFTTIYLEYGNETGGSAHGSKDDPWWGISMGRENMVEACERVFSQFLKWDNLKLICPSFYKMPEITALIAEKCPSVHLISLGAYWGSPYDGSVPDLPGIDYRDLWRRHREVAGDKGLCVYECGNHQNYVPEGFTLDGWNKFLDRYEESAIYTVYLKWLCQQSDGPVCVFTFNGRGAPRQEENQPGYVDLWSMVDNFLEDGIWMNRAFALIEWEDEQPEPEPEPEPEPDDIVTLGILRFNRTTGKLEVQISNGAFTIDAKELGL